MKRGDVKIISAITGYSQSLVYKVLRAEKSNTQIEELIALAKMEDRILFFEKSKQVKAKSLLEKSIKEMAFA